MQEQSDPTQHLYPYSNHKASDAALRFLLEKNSAGYDQLIGLCYIACRGLYFPNAWASYTTKGDTLVGQEEVMRDFIVGWLNDELKPHKDKFADEIQLLEPRLRHIPRRCRLAVISKIRTCPSCGQRKTKECVSCGRIFSHRDINTGVKICPKCGGSELHVVCRDKCETPQIKKILDAAAPTEEGPGTNLSEYVIMRVPDKDVTRFLRSARPLLEQIHPSLYVYLRLVLIHFEKGGEKRYITNQLAKLENVSLKVARKHRKEIVAAFHANLHRPIVQELYQMLSDCQDDPRPELAIPISPITRSAIVAKKEAGELNRKAERELGIKHLPQPEEEPTWADPDEARGSATWTVLADGGMREIAAQDTLEYEIRDVGDEGDIRAFFGVKESDPIPLEIDPECMAANFFAFDQATGYNLEEIP
jgi:hypothetical protein